MTDAENTRDLVTSWMERYRTAWDSNDPDDIRALFTDDAVYRSAPWRDPWEGPDDIVREWIARRDEPGDYSFDWHVAGVDGGRAFVQGVTRYEKWSFSNLWVIDFAADGRASSFTEWFMDQATPDEIG